MKSPGVSLMVAEVLSIEGVRKGFSRGRQWTGVLEGVSFEVLPGEVVAIVGGRVGGKTTLLKIAAGMERPDGGSVSLGSRRLAERGYRPWWARLLGREIVWIGRGGPEREIVWIDRNGPDLDVEVSKLIGWQLALHGRGRRRAEQVAVQALERVGARECVGRRWRELSDWQRVLVGLAGAFAGSPRFVVVDDLLDVDAFGNRATEEASDLLRSLVEQSEPRCGVLMSVSERESAVFADRVFTLTRKGTLKALSGSLGDDAEVIPFPSHAKGHGSRGVGS
jgi:ABC-type nitrate/sulfonate/bicarbonate transport system ATPase subunit